MASSCFEGWGAAVQMLGVQDVDLLVIGQTV
jgi:hypothetical protein